MNVFNLIPSYLSNALDGNDSYITILQNIQ